MFYIININKLILILKHNWRCYGKMRNLNNLLALCPINIELVCERPHAVLPHPNFGALINHSFLKVGEGF